MPMQPADRNRFPRRFGPYVIVSFLGEGGMGNVYLALMGTKDAERLCVIKQMGSTWSSLSAAQIPDMEQRFSREAEIAMSLSHPSIAKTFHAGNDDEGPFLVQEFIDGTTLDSLVLSGDSAAEEIPIAIASHVVCQIAGALGYLHDFQSRGLVHRDVTPDNIMLSFDGEVKLIDFGVAKSTASDDSSTQRGLVGKADWIAPELFKGQKLDRRADLFSLGLVYWYLLSGKHPGSTLANPTGSTARFAPPSAFNPEIPNELDQVVAKAVDPNPDRRFQTGDEFRQAASRFVPAGFEPGRELPALLSRYTSSRELKKKGLELLLAEARPLLDEGKPVVVPVAGLMGPPPVAPPVSPAAASSELEVPPLRRRKSKWPIFAVLIAIATAGLVAVLGSVITKHPAPLPEAQPPAIPPAVPSPTPTPQVPSLPSIPSTQAQPQPPTPRPAPSRADLRPSVPVAPDVSKRKPRVVSPKLPVRSSDSQATAEQLLESALESFERSDLAEASEFAQMALKQGAGTRAYILIGRIAARRKDFSAAQAAFEQALRLSPGNPQATRLLEKVRRGSPEDLP